MKGGKNYARLLRATYGKFLATVHKLYDVEKLNEIDVTTDNVAVKILLARNSATAIYRAANEG